MTIKHNFMPRIVAVSLLSLSPLITHAASADPVAKVGKPQRSTKDGWYLGADIGHDILDTSRWSDWKNHYNFSTELGYKKDHWRYEAQYTHFVDKYRGFFGGTQNTSLILGNVYYDFDNPNSKFTPFIGAGLGYMFNRGSDTLTTTTTNNNVVTSMTRSGTGNYHAAVAQITAGVSYQVTDNLSAKISYRQLFTTNSRTGVFPAKSLFGAGFSYKFD